MICESDCRNNLGTICPACTIQSLRETQAVLVEALKEVLRCEAQWPIEQMYDLDKEMQLKASLEQAKAAIAHAEASK